MSETIPEPYSSIYGTFKKTKEGKLLASRVRYERYKPENVSNQRWEQLLGPDVNNLGHMFESYVLARHLVKQINETQPDLLSPEDARKLQVSAIIHDWGEAKVGDITYTDKTAEAEAREKAAFKEYQNKYYTGDTRKLIDSASNDIIFDHEGKNSKLGLLFNVIERMGYMNNLLKASQHVVDHDAQDCDTGLRWIVADVLCNQPPALLKYAKQLNPVNQYLVDRDDQISTAYSVIDHDMGIFEHYREQQSDKRIAFERSEKAWQMWERQSTLSQPVA